MTQWDQNTFWLFPFGNWKHFFQFHDTLKDWIFVCNENGYSLRSHYYSENLFQSHGKPALITVVDPIFIAGYLFSKKGDPCTARALWDALFVKLTESNNQFQAVNSEIFLTKRLVTNKKTRLGLIDKQILENLHSYFWNWLLDPVLQKKDPPLCTKLVRQC